MKHRKSDILWKVILEEVFADLLRFVYHDADKVYDMERGFRFLDKELAELNPVPDEGKDSRFADKLVQVYHRDGLEEWVLLHVEVQGDTNDRDAFAERMYTYFYRIRDRHHLLVSALAIFTGQNGNDMPARYSYEYRGTRLTYEYPTLSVREFSDADLDNSSNPFAQVIVAARIRLKEGKVTEDELLNLKVLAARRLFARGFEPAKVRSIFNFLRNYVLFEKPETNRKFDNQIKKADKAGIMNTLEYVRMEGKEEGRAEERRNAVVALLANTEFSIEKIAGILGVSTEFVIKVNDESRVRK